MALPTLPPALRSLAARVATERFRPDTWKLAAELRLRLRGRLAAGEAAADLEAELRREIDSAARRGP